MGIKNGEWWTSESLIKLKNPSCTMVVGATGTGKSYHTSSLIMNIGGIYEKNPPEKITFCFAVWQKIYSDLEEKLPNITFKQGLPSREEIDELTGTADAPNFLVLDDLLAESLDDPKINLLFTVHSHHKHITCIFLTQNIYAKGKYARNITLNCSYIVLFKNSRDSSQIRRFASQVAPGNVPFVMSAYNNATSYKHGYLLVDLTPTIPDEYRYRTKIFPGEETQLYLPS
jgi:hypothetical protein